MRFLRRGWVVAVMAAIGAAVAVLVVNHGGGSSTPTGTVGPPAPVAIPPKPKDKDHEPEPQNTKQAVQQAVREAPRARLDPAQRAVADAVRGYVGAFNRDDGERVCASYVPGALDSVKFPEKRTGCAATVSASIGYADPRGFPVFKSSRVARILKAEVSGSSARVTATTVTQFAGGREPSIEDDVLYVTRRGDRWLLVKPDLQLYRAIGVGDIPPSALAPP